MISDDMLRAAAAKSNTDYVAFLAQDYDAEHPHDFSEKFEKRIKKVQRRADHPTFYQVQRRVASFLLILLVGASVWLATDVEARAAVFGWVKDFYENYFVLRHEDTPIDTEGVVSYRPTWLPEGYTEFLVDDSDIFVYVAYTNTEGQLLTFNYISNSPENNWFIDISTSILKKTYVNKNPADLLISTDPTVANGIAWTSGNTAFYINAFLDEDALIAIAESVQSF